MTVRENDHMKVIEAALEALGVAKDCGGELDLEMYAKAYWALSTALCAVREHDRILNAAEASPTGADYEHVIKLLGLRPEPAAKVLLDNVPAGMGGVMSRSLAPLTKDQLKQLRADALSFKETL